MTRRPGVSDWTVVASCAAGEFGPAARALERWGPVSRTVYYNVLVLRAEDPLAFLGDFASGVEAEPALLHVLGRVVPCQRTFDFQDRDSFEAGAAATALSWTTDLAGQTFHVRMHRRGFKKRLSSQEGEQFLAGVILAELERRGTPASITFDDPAAILSVETVGGRAGLSLWSREELARYPFLGLD